MDVRRRTWFDDRGLIVAGGDGERALRFYAGAMHYWRVPPAQWAACLRELHALGLTCVETCVPWRVHETAPGEHAWSGARDLARFLTLAREAGLAVVLRPGPSVNAELTCFGLPDHVVAEPACQARTAHGTPVWMPSPPRAWPVPSYASHAFRERVRAWYAAVADVVRPHLAPEGPVVALGIDSATQLFFRLGAYDHDYHPEAIAWWTEATGLDGDPPRAWSAAAAARCVSWVRFKDQYVARALHELGRLLDDVGLAGIARFHDLPPGHAGDYDLPRIQHAIHGPAGITANSARAEFRALRRRALACTGNARPIPVAFAVGLGGSAWWPPAADAPDPDRARDQLLTLLACGLRGFDLAMAVERERYHGAAIGQRGVREPHARWIRPLLDALAEVDWPALRRPAAIALVDTRADARFGIASSLLDPVTPVLAELLALGPGGAAELGTDAGAIAARRWQSALASALELAAVPYEIVDESTPAAELARYRAVIAPTLERVDHGLWRRLAELAEHRGAAGERRTIVVIGPVTPVRDELDQPLADGPPRRIGRLKAGSLEDLRGLADDLAALAGEPSAAEAWQVERPDEVRALAYADADGTTRVVFVVSDAPQPVIAVLRVDAGARALRDPFAPAPVPVAGGRASIAMPARGVRMVIVER